MQESFVATNLAKARKGAGYSMKNLAELIDCDEGLIEEWELGTSEPNITQTLLLSSLYGLSVEDIFSDFDFKKILPKVKLDDFSYNSWLNRISNKEYL